MFIKTDEEFLLRRLGRNEVMLFLGAGFSTLASNKAKVPLPTGSQFCQILWSFMGLDGEWDKTTPLNSLYELLLSRGIAKERIREMLIQTFEVREYSKTYNSLLLPFWYKIYTLNIDNLVEKIYFDSSRSTKSIRYPFDHYEERDQTLESTLIVHLNGRIPCDPEDIIFGKSQYAAASIDIQPLYHQFVNDFSVYPTIFLGTQIEEQLLDQYIQVRQRKKSEHKELRPKSFLITKNIPNAKVELLKIYNIVAIDASVEDFLAWLSSKSEEIPDRLETLSITQPSFHSLITKVAFPNRLKEAIEDFAVCFKKVPIDLKDAKPNKRGFLLGSSPAWGDIISGIDAPRLVTTDVNNDIEETFKSRKTLQLYALTGSAGSGKSTILKRLGLTLTRNGRTVFFSYSESIPEIDSIVKTLEHLKERVILIFDNADLIISNLPRLLGRLENINQPPVVVLGIRSHFFDMLNGNLKSMHDIKRFQVRDLQRQEVISILKVLEDNGVLGTLKGLTQPQRINEIEKRAKKQLLVAMKEATTGRNFDEIILDEFNEIEPKEAKVLTLCVAIATEAGFTVAKNDFVGFSRTTPNEALNFLEECLIDVVLKVGALDSKLMLRHRVIADVILTNADPSDLSEAYIRILTTLAGEINKNDYLSGNRKFVLYKSIINHKRIYQRFGRRIESTREIYESIKPYFNDDFHFWLQYGSLELEGVNGDLTFAENYLNQANSLKPDNFFVQNTLAHLYFKQSLEVESISIAKELRETASTILFEQFRSNKYDDSHCYHIYCAGEYKWLLQWVTDLEELRQNLTSLLKICQEAVKKNPYNKIINYVHDTVSRAHLLVGLNRQVEIPTLMDDLDNSK